MNASRYSFLEIALIVFILVVYLSLTIPSYILDRAQEKQLACEANLIELAKLQKNFYKLNHRYTDKFEELGWDVPKGVYEYQLSAQGDYFTAGCEGNIDTDANMDIATINETGQITRVSDDINL